MRVISFYSYKGGTGRTLLVANLAVYAARLGQTVAMVDLDLEAPGLAYKFLSSPPGRPGVIEWLTAPRQPTVAEMVEPLEVHFPFNRGGAMWLIGAGPPPSQNYLRDVRHLQSTAFADDSAPAVAGLLDLRDAIETELQPDILLLDARTGISNTNAVTTRVLADEVVALTLNTREQLEGTREVLRSLAALSKPRDSNQPLGLHIVISRIPDPERGTGDTDHRGRDEVIAEQVRQFLTEPTEPLTATLNLSKGPLLLHQDTDIAEHERLLLADRTNFDRSRPLHFDYLRVAERLWGSDILGPAVAQAFENLNDIQRLERGEFFGDINQILASKAPAVSAATRPPTGQDRSVLKRKVELLRKAVKTDPTRQPDLAEALTALAWATFDARTPSTPNGLRLMREAQRHYSDLAGQLPAQYNAALLESLIQYSAMAAQLGHLHDAQTAAVEAVDLATDESTRQFIPATLEGKALMNLAAIRHGAGQNHMANDAIHTATRIFDSHLDLLQHPEIDFLLLRASAYNYQSVIEAIVGDTAHALRSGYTATDAYRDLLANDSTPLDSTTASFGRALNNLANILRECSEFDAAVQTAEEAVGVLRNLASDAPETYLADLAAAYQTLSVSIADTGEYSLALQIAEHATHLRRDLVETAGGQREVPGLIAALNNLAARSSQLGRYSEAVRAATEAIELARTSELELSEQTNPDETLIRALRDATGPTWANLVAIYRNSGKPDQVVQAAPAAEAAFTAAGSTESRAYVDLLLSVAESYLALNNNANAYAYARRAIELAEGTAAASAHRLAARANLSLDPAAAIAAAERSLELAINGGDPIGQALSLQILSDAHSAAGHTKQAAAFGKRAVELRNQVVHGTAPDRP